MVSFSQGPQLTIHVNSEETPLAGVTVYYTCDWGADLGDWTSWNSGVTDVDGVIVTPIGDNLNNVEVTIGVIPWDISDEYGDTYCPGSFHFDELIDHQEIEFNFGEVVTEITVTSPASEFVTADVGASIALSADVILDSPCDVDIDFVTFEIDGEVIDGVLTGGDSYGSITDWSPTEEDFYNEHIIVVSVTDSDGNIQTESLTFFLDCSGVGCPNQLPVIEWVEPAPTTINQPDGFEEVTIVVNVTDEDGTIVEVLIDFDGAGAIPMTFVGGDGDSYSFTPTEYTTYPAVITATDDEGESTDLTKIINVISTVFTPLPDKVIVGYWHSWDHADAPFMYLEDAITTNYNVVVYSFIETLDDDGDGAADGYDPVLTIHEPGYLTGGVFDPELLKDDIEALQAEGIPVLVSIGGQNGHVELNTVAEKDIFVAGIIDIVEEYGFDGLDLDFEGGSMNFGGGDLSDFSYATIEDGDYPKLQNVIDAVIEVDDHFGEGFHITAAPETFYMQVGHSTYTSSAGSFLPVVHNIRDILDYIHVQLYNTGSVNALDGVAYAQGEPDFIVSMTDMLIKGFEVAGTGITFEGLDQTQVAIGLPACPSAAPAGGYVTPSEVIQALTYLMEGVSFGGGYDLEDAVYPNLRGVMTWSINWDASEDCGSAYEFADNTYDYLFGDIVEDVVSPVAVATDLIVYVNVDGEVTVEAEDVDDGSSDDVGITSMTLSQTLFDCTHLGENTVSLTVYDAAGNTSSIDAIITVLDTISPLINAMDITVYLIGDEVTVEPEDVDDDSEDNCSIESLGLIPNVFAEAGVYLAVFSVTDPSGNSSEMTVEITVLETDDEEAPVVITQDLVIYLDADGEAFITPEDVDDGSSDDVEIVSFELDIEVFTCEDLGGNIVTLTAYDLVGNNSSGTAEVTVLDTISPIALAQDLAFDITVGETITITSGEVNDGSNDNCNIVDMILSETEFTESGIYNVVLTVEDESGNMGETAAVISIGTLGIKESLENVELRLYPNPAEKGSNLLIECSEKINRVEIINSLGQVVQLIEGDSDVTSVQLEKVVSGWVTIRFTTENGSTFCKVLIVQ